MTKKNKARKPNKQTGPGRNEAVPGFPDSRHPADAIAWWRDSLRGGFSPVGAAEHLNACLANSAGTDLASAFAALLELAALPLADTNLAVALKGAPLAALLDPDSSRLLVADAAFGGLACNSLDTGRAIWEVEPEGAAQVRGMALLDNMLIYCDTWQNRVVALDATDGTCLWETGEARDGRPLTAPSAVVPVEVESGRELWVADYAGHRICRFTLDGAPLGSIGRRGLTAEETAHNFTRKKGTPRQVYFEFPFSLNTGVDSDGARAIFVWDWWNGRVQVLSPDGRLLRQIQLEMPPGISGRFAGQVTVVSGPSSLLIFGIDDTACSLLIWSAYGELLINVKLLELIFGDSGRAERVRLCNAPSGVTALYLLATDGRLYRLDDRFLDPHRLLESLTAVYPDSPRMALVRAGLPGG
ncbi:MAG TPA: PQQ-binding-like beta-propeller repeat protein, partial [Candidatus Glassbacteria bacterium]|nr:PQQ-binding-like beta-propeller repeat protein [Candidatus Glassbacteria bacterium]